MDVSIDKTGFLGLKVEQVRCAAPEFERFVGRRGIVTDAIVDEKGTVHVQTDDGVWCPFYLLAVL